MKLTIKNITLFIAPLLVVIFAMVALSSIDIFVLAMTTMCAYGLMMIGWILVEIFGD